MNRKPLILLTAFALSTGAIMTIVVGQPLLSSTPAMVYSGQYLNLLTGLVENVDSNYTINGNTSAILVKQ